MVVGAELIEERFETEFIHAGRTVETHQQKLCFPREDQVPPLAVERTVLPEGPTRPPVILVHGLAQNRYTWRVSGRSMSGFLAEAGYEVLNLELRGHGNSRLYGGGQARGFDDYVEDFERVVRACDRPPFAIGHSLGGAVIVAGACRTPLAGLIPIAGVFTFATRNRFMRGVARLSLKMENVLTLGSVRISTGWAGELIARLYSLTDISGFGLPLAGWAPGSMEEEILGERLERGFDWTSVEVWIQMSRWARGEPFAYAPAFSQTDVPLLVIAGDNDPLLPPADAKNCFQGSGSSDREMVVFEPFEYQVHWGHVDLILGRHAPKWVWPKVVGWMDARS
jgi:polyhydroxyalkanoate synthase subunit PhaC